MMELIKGVLAILLIILVLQWTLPGASSIIEEIIIKSLNMVNHSLDDISSV